MNVRTLVMMLALVVLGVACKKELDSPPIPTLPVGSVITIAQLKALYTTTPLHFDTAVSVYATVTSDENDGNFYKNITVQDHTGGITLRLLNSGGLYVGDSIRIYLPGTVVAPYAGLMQIDSVDVDNNVVKQATLVHVEPLAVTIDEIDPVTMQSMLIRLDSVEFTTADAIGNTWADAVNQDYGENYLEDCDGGNTVMVRTSGFANYASQPLPTGKGSILCVVGLYWPDPDNDPLTQLAARRMSDVHLNGPRCPGQELPYFFKNFQDQSLTSGGWTQQIVTGTTNWTISDLGSSGNYYGYCNNFTNGNAAESWLISPAVDITGLTSPGLNFRTACNFSGPLMEVLVSTNYDGSSAPSTATWTPLSPALSSGSFTWTPSGTIDLAPWNSANFRVAFKYVGTDSDGRAWEVDDIKIFEQ